MNSVVKKSFINFIEKRINNKEEITSILRQNFILNQYPQYVISDQDKRYIEKEKVSQKIKYNYYVREINSLNSLSIEKGINILFLKGNI